MRILRTGELACKYFNVIDVGLSVISSAATLPRRNIFNIKMIDVTKILLGSDLLHLIFFKQFFSPLCKITRPFASLAALASLAMGTTISLN